MYPLPLSMHRVGNILVERPTSIKNSVFDIVYLSLPDLAGMLQQVGPTTVGLLPYSTAFLTMGKKYSQGEYLLTKRNKMENFQGFLHEVDSQMLCSTNPWPCCQCTLEKVFNPYSPNSDQHRISPHNIHA